LPTCAQLQKIEKLILQSMTQFESQRGSKNDIIQILAGLLLQSINQSITVNDDKLALMVSLSLSAAFDVLNVN
jgi:ribosomal protein L30/L7E